jgi:hypothetical protein
MRRAGEVVLWKVHKYVLQNFYKVADEQVIPYFLNIAI